MSTTVSDSTIKGKYNEVAGKVKQRVGEAVGNHRMANEGTAQEVKGHVQQAWGTVKDAARDAKAQAQRKNDKSQYDKSQNDKGQVEHAVSTRK